MIAEWNAAAALGGVTVGEISVVAAGSVITMTFPRIPLLEEIRRRLFARLAAEGTSASGHVRAWHRSVQRVRCTKCCAVEIFCLVPISVVSRCSKVGVQK